jgi:hypothetical protein
VRATTTTTLRSVTTTTMKVSCQKCKTGVGYCGNPPLCNICVVSAPIGCSLPARGTWKMTSSTQKSPSFSKNCTYSGPASGSSGAGEPLPSKCTQTTKGATATCGYDGRLYSFTCVYP